MRLGRAAVAGGAALLAGIAALSWMNRVEPAVDPGGPGPTGPAGPIDAGWRVSRVVDGDTIKVTRNGEQLTVRLIGIDTPETVKPDAPVECYGPQASQFAKDLLDGSEVVLEADPSQQSTDRYGRTLAYVWLVDAGSMSSMFKVSSMFNLQAVRSGAAREATYDGPYQWQQILRDAQDEARAQGRGLWGSCDAP